MSMRHFFPKPLPATTVSLNDTQTRPHAHTFAVAQSVMETHRPIAASFTTTLFSVQSDHFHVKLSKVIANYNSLNVSHCCVPAGEGQHAGAAQVRHAPGEGLQPVGAAEPGGLGDLPELRPGEGGGRPQQGGHLQEAVGYLLRGLGLLLPGLHLPVLREGEHLWYVCLRTGRVIHGGAVRLTTV